MIMVKQRYAAMTMSFILAASLFGGCTADNKSDSQTSESGKESQAVYGEVVSLSDESIKIETGTLKEMSMQEKTDRENKDGESIDEDQTDGELINEDQSTGEKPNNDQTEDDQPSMLELTGEEQEILVTEDTVVKRQEMGRRPGREDGDASEPPQNGQEKPEDGQKPSGDSEETTGNTQNSSEETQNTTNENQPSSENGQNKPEGEAPEAEEISLSDISEGDTVAITLDDDGNASQITVMSMRDGKMAQNEKPDSYEAVKKYNSDTEAESEEIRSVGTDENGILVSDGASVKLKDITVSRNSTDSTGGDSSSFYGVGAALLATDGTVSISGSTIETDSAGGAGLFAYENGTIYAADTTVKTTQDTSGGIHASGGGTLYAWDMDVETDGESSAAIRSDRGGGTMVVDGGNYISNGTGSPAVYSTADITVNNAQLTANGSEAVCIEGRNSLRLFDSDLTGAMEDSDQNDCTWNVILYQSMSGDSEAGNSIFEMNGGTLTARNGGMFYTTNTESTITLSDVDITYADDSEFFLKCTGNQNQRGWGSTGENGADCLFTAIKQTMEGDVVWDSISNLDFYMTDGSTLKGAVTNDESCAGDGGEGYCNLYIGEDSTWTVTGDSTVSVLASEGTIVDEDDNTVTIEGTDGTVYVEGDSDYTVTVDSYTDSADLSGASSAVDWSQYQVEKPSEL